MKLMYLLFIGIILTSQTVLMASDSEMDGKEITEQTVNDLPETGAGVGAGAGPGTAPSASKKEDCE